MERAHDRRRGWTAWADRGRRIAATPHAPVAAAALLASLAVAESIAHLTGALPAYPLVGETVSVPAGEAVTGPGHAPATEVTPRFGDASGGEAGMGSGDVPADEAIARLGGPPPVPNPGTPSLLVASGLLGLATTLPVAIVRAQPAVAAVAVSAAGLLSLSAFHTLTAAGVAAQLICCYRLGRTGSQPLAVLLTVPFVLVAVAGTALGGTGVLTMLAACLSPAAALAGIARRAHTRAADDDAARRVVADTLLEHTARGERARIARELHDVVAHHISMVAVQAETARLTTPGMPATGAERLSAIGDTARAALTEMRSLLGVLREDTGAETPDRRPQPGLSPGELNELIDEARDASGTGLRLILTGPPVPLGPGVELAAYRIVQEALTNARRHAPGAAVDVELHYTGDGLRLTVRDNGPGPATAAPYEEHGLPAVPYGGHEPPAVPYGGHGLSGMRERAAAVGGELRAGPAAGGGFLVEARLPARDGEPG
ncbi:sensor histidine kinase [Planobispora takensis]|uniref:sensor histidine kinase n=1 Tax=Planobispora takensis TaxID=1367882 RepID=UPI001945A89D|nr:sensor histidine kinase [Planobispora takensis]